METRLAHFAALLRQNGLPLSTSELIDATRAAALVGFEDRERFRAALAACLVKSAKRQATFDRLFELFFCGTADFLQSIEGALFEAIERAGLLERAELDRIAEALRRLAPQLSPLTRACLEGDASRLWSLLNGAALSIDFSKLDAPEQKGFFARRLLAKAGAGEMAADLDRLDAFLRAQGVSLDGLDLSNRKLREALRRVERAAGDWVDQEARLRARHGEVLPLEEKPFEALAPEEAEAVSRAVRRLAERLRTRLVYRQPARRRGRLDVRRTLRQNLAADGAIARLTFRRRKPVRPELVVLCDLSDSVRGTARMMMHLVQVLQTLFGKTRSFAFVNAPTEVTALVQEAGRERPLDLARLSASLDLGGNSNYGRVFDEMVRSHLGSLGRRTTLLVIGDGRNNFGEPGFFALEALSRRVGRLLWITPEPRARWREGDCELARYEKACTRVAVVRDLADLEGLAEALVPRQGNRG